MTYPSDFKPTKSIETVTQIFESNEFPFGYMLDGQKWKYSVSFPNHLVIFNANSFHMSMDYFGHDKETGRLFQVFFFSTEKQVC